MSPCMDTLYKKSCKPENKKKVWPFVLIERLHDKTRKIIGMKCEESNQHDLIRYGYALSGLVPRFLCKDRTLSGENV